MTLQDNIPPHKYQIIPREQWTPNDWADFQRYSTGLNLIPATNNHSDPKKCKKPFWTDEQGLEHWITWKESGYQTNSISEEQHQQWKDSNAFKDGMALICGQVFHNKTTKGLWGNGIDCDNLLGIQEFCGERKDGSPVSLAEVAKDTVVEQHANKEKCHIIVNTKEPILSKAPLQGDNIPKIEIKSGGNKLLYCAGGYHKDGSLIDIVGSEQVAEFPKDKLEDKLNKIFKKYDIPYLETAAVGLSDFQKPHYEVDEKIHEGSDRGGHILSYLDSKKIKNQELNEDTLFQMAREYEKKNCVGQYDDSKIWGLVKQAIKYGEEKILENGNQGGNKAGKDNCIIERTAVIVKTNHDFVTVRKTDDVLIYNGKIYSKDDAESIIKEETEKLIKNCSTHQRNEVVNKIKAQTGRSIEEFDKDPKENTIENGILNLNNLELKDHSPSNLSRVLLPVQYITSQYPIDNDSVFDDLEKNLKDTLFWQSLKKCFAVGTRFQQESFESVLEMIASTFVKKHIDAKSFINLGGGENGKSVFLSYITAMLGKANICGIPLQEVENDKFMAYNLLGKMANIFADLKNNELKYTGKIKAIICNEGIEVQAKHGQPFTGYPFCKMIFSCNRFPKVFDQGQGFFRRWIIIKWERNFENDPEKDSHLLEKLLSNKEEMSRVFSCLVHLARRLEVNGRYSHSKDWKHVQKEWNENADPLDQFETKHIVESENHKTKRETYRLYKKIMLEKGETPLGMRGFGNAFAEYHEEDRVELDGRTERVWLNIGFKVSVQATLKESL